MGKLFFRAIVSLAFVALFALNIATVTVPAVAAGVASTVGTVLGSTALLPEFRTVSYRGQKKRITAAVADTTKRISTRTAKGAARNVGSIAGEAIPVAGIAVVVGVTAWELKDACETMKDLRALELATNPNATEDPSVAEVCGLEVPSKEQAWEAVKASPGQAWEKAKAYVPDLPEWHMPNVPKLQMPDLPDWQLPTLSDFFGEREKNPDVPAVPDGIEGAWGEKLKRLNPFD